MTELKGIDDLLAAGHKPRRLQGGEITGFLNQIRARLFKQRASTPEPEEQAQPTTPIPSTTPAQRPVFPVEVFPGKVEQFTRCVAAAMGCAIDFIGLAILVISGAAIGAARSLQIKGGWHEKPGLYAVIVSKPGTAKTPALKAVIQPIFEAQAKLYEDHKVAQAKYEQDLEVYKEAKRTLKEGEPEPAKPVEPPPLRHIFVNDTTVESLAANLAENRKGLLLFRDELTAWVRSLDMYKGRGTDRQFFLSAWSGEMVKVDRKYSQGKPVIIPYPFVSVLGGIQPDLLAELDSEGGREDGFIHRILFSFPVEGQASAWNDAEISDDQARGWQQVVDRLLNLQPIRPEGEMERPRRLQFSEEGRAAFIAWYNALVSEMNAADFPSHLHGAWSKLRSHCARFALIIHLLRVYCDEAGSNQDEGLIDAEDVRRAALLCDYFKAHLRLVYPRLQQSKEDKMVDDLINWMDRKALQRVTPREIMRAQICGVRKASEAESLLKAAIDRGRGDPEQEPGRVPRQQGPALKAFVRKAA